MHLDRVKYAERVRKIDSVAKYYASKLKVPNIGPNQYALWDMLKKIN